MGSSCVKPSVMEEHRRVVKTMMPPDAYWIGSSMIAVVRKELKEGAVVKMTGSYMSPREVAEAVLEKVHSANAKKAVEISVLGCSVGALLPLWTAQRAFECFSSLPSVISSPAVPEEEEGCLVTADEDGRTRHLTVSFSSPSYLQKPLSFLVAHSSPLRKGLHSEVVERFEHCTVSLIPAVDQGDAEGDVLLRRPDVSALFQAGCTVVSSYVGTPSCHAALAISAVDAASTSARYRRMVLICSMSEERAHGISAHGFLARGEKDDAPSREERIEQGVQSILSLLKREGDDLA